jgi:hypothetical protein
MCALLISLLAGLTSTLRTRASLQFEILALRPTGRSPAQRAKACPASAMGPALVGSPCSPLAELAEDPHGGQARDGHRLASKRFPVLLEMEEPPGTKAEGAGESGLKGQGWQEASQACRRLLRRKDPVKSEPGHRDGQGDVF